MPRIHVPAVLCLAAIALASCGGDARPDGGELGAGRIVGAAPFVSGAEVALIDLSGGARGAELAVTELGPNGEFEFDISDFDEEARTILVQVRKAAGERAVYTEPATGLEGQLSPTVTLDALLTRVTPRRGYEVYVTVWSHIAASFSAGLWETAFAVDGQTDPDQFERAVEEAYSLLSLHFAASDETLIRSVRPADTSDPDQVTDLSVETTYGLAIAGFSQLALEHTESSGVGEGVLNSLTLAATLAEDLRSTSDGFPPRFDGEAFNIAPLLHGDVEITSLTTRCDLALSIVAYVEDNANYAGAFGEIDLADFLDRVSRDNNRELYPDEGCSLDELNKPTVSFVAPTPSEGTVLNGALDLLVVASDERELRELAWVTEEVTDVFLDQSGGPAGPWRLSGKIETNCDAEGEFSVEVIAKDNSREDMTKTRTVIVDCTAPEISPPVAMAGGLPLADGATTGAAIVTVTGQVSEENALAAENGATFSWHGSAAAPLELDDEGRFSLELAMDDGPNTLVLEAVDIAGNVLDPPVAVTYVRDASPPTVEAPKPPFAATVLNEEQFSVSTSPTTVAYDSSNADLVSIENGARFGKFATRYTSVDAENLPIWRFNVTDARSETVSLAYQIFQGSTPLTPVTPAEAIDGAGFTHRVVVHAGLAPEIAEVSGTLTLEVRATDGFGNVSEPRTVTWRQTILAPPLFAQAAPEARINDNIQRSPFGYTLGASPLATGGGIDNMGEALDYQGLPMRLAAWVVSNPNDVPVVVTATQTIVALRASYRVSFADFSRGTASGINRSCDSLGREDTREGGGCYTRPADRVRLRNSLEFPATDGVEAVDLVTGGVVLPCANCTSGTYELAPRQQIVLYLTNSDGLDFLGPYRDRSSGLPNRTGIDRTTFRRCTRLSLNGCDVQERRQEVEFLAQILVTTQEASVQFRTRLDPSGRARAATGLPTSVPGSTLVYRSAEDGYSLPPSNHNDF